MSRAGGGAGSSALSDEEIGAELANLFRGAGIQVAKEGNRHIAVGISIKEPTGKSWFPHD